LSWFTASSWVTSRNDCPFTSRIWSPICNTQQTWLLYWFWRWLYSGMLHPVVW
jgi:hypothetical protein